MKEKELEKEILIFDTKYGKVTFKRRKRLNRMEEEKDNDTLILNSNKIKIGIFTKPIHIEKIVNFLNQNTGINYVISTSKEEIHGLDFDIGISYCFPYIVRMKEQLMDDRMWYNYHPAPLPEYAGLLNYSLPISDKIRKFGVTLHIMTDNVDKGEILKIKMFKLDSPPINTNELGCITHYHLFQLFKETIELLLYSPKNKKEFDDVFNLFKLKHGDLK